MTITHIAPTRYLRLILALTAVAGIWMIVLPWIAQQPSEYRSWNALQQAGIDPSAMYYSELDAMAPILDRLNRGEKLNTRSIGPGIRIP